MKYPLVLNRLIIALTTILFLIFLSNLEFGSFKTKSIIYPLIWICIPIVGLNLFNRLRGSSSVIRKSLLGLGAAFYLFGTIVFGMRLLLCAEIDHGTLFKNKNNSQINLECRTYDCYGTAESCQLYKVRYLIGKIKLVTKYNQEPVDESKWQRISLSSR